MIRKCCLPKDQPQERHTFSDYYHKSSRSNTKNAKSKSNRKANSSKRNDNHIAENEQWKMLLNQIGQIKDKIVRFTNDYSQHKTPKKTVNDASLNHKIYASSELSKKNRNCRNCSLSGKRAIKQQRRPLRDNIDLNCPISVFPLQKSCMFSCQSRQPITDFRNGHYNSNQINFSKQNIQPKPMASRFASTIGPNLGHISLVIDSKLGNTQYQPQNTDMDQLGKKIKKLQEKNINLIQQKVLLQHRLLFQQQQKKELKKMVFADAGKALTIKQQVRDFVCVSTPKRSSHRQAVSPIIKYGIKRSQQYEKSPYQVIKDKLGLSNYSREISHKLITQSNTSSPESLNQQKVNSKKASHCKPKRQMQFEKLKPSENISSIKTMYKIGNSNEESEFHSRIQDFSDFLCIQKQNQRVFESRKTNKNNRAVVDGLESQLASIHQSKYAINEKSRTKNESKCSKRSGYQQNGRESNAKIKDCRENFPKPIIVQSNIKISENPQFEQRFSPRITFSREAIPMVCAKNLVNSNKANVIQRIQSKLQSSEVIQIHKKADKEKLKMLQIYFERLIQFSRQEQNREKKNRIRKEMSEIALQIQELREKLEQK